MTFLIFIIILGVLVLVHEAGHFWAARRSKVGVLEFGFGFPPKLVGFRRSRTLYSLNLIPFGGFVRLVGESDPTVTGPDSYASAPLPKKIFILVAGVAMNYLLAWALFSLVLTAGVMVERSAVPANAFAQFTDTRVEAFVSPNSPAAQAGLHSGDIVATIDGQRFTETSAVVDYTQSHQRPTLMLEVTSGGQRKTITVKPAASPRPNEPVYGFGIQEVGELSYPWYVAPWYGLERTASVTKQTLEGFGQLVTNLVTKGRVGQDLSGPVGIAVLTGEIRRLGLIPLVHFTALLSVSLAVINFLPLPALDGGRAAWLVIERLSRRRFNPRWEQAVHAAGFYLLLLLVVIISIRDVQRFELIDRVVKFFR